MPRLDPLAALHDDDLQLALWCCYELHYRGFDGVDPDLEWDPEVLRTRRQLEVALLGALHALVPLDDTGREPCAALIDLTRSPADGTGGPSLSTVVRDHATLDQVRELFVHRSIYQLKEADPHTWAIPRVSGRAKSALVEIQMDEYGGGQPGATHAELFAATLDEVGLDPTYGAHLDAVPGIPLATDNLRSLLGLHRSLLPAVIGHLALFELTSVGPMGRYAAALDRLGVGERGRRFFDVHVTADAVHQVVAVQDLVGPFLDEHPDAGPRLVWGAAALTRVEAAFSSYVLGCWDDGRSSLRASPAPALALGA